MFGNHLAHCRYCHKQKITTDCINYGCERPDFEKCPGYQKYLENRTTLLEFGSWAPKKADQKDVDKALDFLLEQSETTSYFKLLERAIRHHIKDNAFDEAVRNLRDSGRLKVTDKHDIVFIPWSNFVI